MSYSGPYPLPVIGGGTNHSTNPSFFVYLATGVNGVTGDSTTYLINFDSVQFDTTSSYSTGTGLFTAPITGNYFFSMYAFLTGIDVTNTQGNASFLTSGSLFYPIASNSAFPCANAGQLSYTGNAIVAMTASQTIGAYIQVNNGNKGVNVAGATSPNFFTAFFGYLLI